MTIFLDCAASLTLWESFVADVNLRPSALVVLVVSLDGVDVLARGVSNTAENVNGVLAEGTRAVVVTAYVQVWHFEPKINI